MARAGVVRVARNDLLELAYDFIGAGVGSPVGLPVVPRAEVHQRFGIQGRGVEVVGIGVGDPLHRARVQRVQPGTIGRRDRRVALRNRLDVRALRHRGVGLERQRFLRRRVRGDSARRVHWSIDVRAVGECDPPVAHGAGGIELCGARERADRFRVIESVDESQALVEVLLCGRDSSGDAFVVGAEVRVERDRVRKARRRRGGLDEKDFIRRGVLVCLADGSLELRFGTRQDFLRRHRSSRHRCIYPHQHDSEDDKPCVSPHTLSPYL